MKERFSAAAQTYDRHAAPQEALARRVIEAVPDDRRPDRILELGAGTGLLTALLLRRFPESRIDALDLAEGMVERGRERFARFPAVRWFVGDARHWRGEAPYPLVVSSAALHWSADLRGTFVNIRRNLAAGGCFVVGLMTAGTLAELHDLRREIAPTKPPPVRLPAADEAAEALEAAGLRIRRREEELLSVRYPDARAFLRALHEQGVTARTAGRQAAPLTRGELARLIAAYQERYGAPDGTVQAAYRTAVFVACVEE